MSGWRRVNKRATCLICGRPKYCGLATDGSAAICMWVRSDRPTRNGGWLHWLTPDIGIRDHVGRATTVRNRRPPRDFDQLSTRYERAATDRHIEGLGRELGVTAESLRGLRVGWDSRAWTFPMFDGTGRVIGIRRRFSNGYKCCITGSANGLFIPAGLPNEGRLFVAEGPTDTAALLNLGFAAIGRPSCNGGTAYIVEVARSRDTVIVGDRDAPGQRGAIQLACELRGICPSVDVIVPPPGVKDARAWRQAGATRRDIESTLRHGPIVHLPEHIDRAIGVSYRETG